MGSLPTIEDVYSQTDMEFHKGFPDAPERLDEQNPDHAQWITEWNRIRLEVCNRWADQAFYDRYPIGRWLNPNDPGDATYIEYWNDIREQIDGRGGRFDWSAAPAAPAADETASATAAVHNPVTSTTPELEEPPTAEEMSDGWAGLDNYVHAIVGSTTELAEKVLGLGGWEEVAPVLLDGGGKAIELLEAVGIESSAVFAGSALATIVGPFAMWYDAIGANNAGNLEHLRWEVYRPWMDGFIAGLYNTAPGAVDPLFEHMRDRGFDEASSLTDLQKRAVVGALIATYLFDAGDTVSDRLTDDQWRQRINPAHAYRGLEIALSRAGS